MCVGGCRVVRDGRLPATASFFCCSHCAALARSEPTASCCSERRARVAAASSAARRMAASAASTAPCRLTRRAPRRPSGLVRLSVSIEACGCSGFPSALMPPRVCTERPRLPSRWPRRRTFVWRWRSRQPRGGAVAAAPPYSPRRRRRHVCFGFGIGTGPAPVSPGWPLVAIGCPGRLTFARRLGACGATPPAL